MSRLISKQVRASGMEPVVKPQGVRFNSAWFHSGCGAIFSSFTLPAICNDIESIPKCLEISVLTMVSKLCRSLRHNYSRSMEAAILRVTSTE